MWDRVKTGIRGAWEYTRSRLQQITVVAALFVVLGAGFFAVSPRDDEPSAVGLEMAGDPATFAQVLADVGPSISGSSAPPAAAIDKRGADREKHGKRRPKLHRGEFGGEGAEHPARSHDGQVSVRGASPTCSTYVTGDDECRRAVHLARQALRRDRLFISAYLIWALGLCLLGATSVKRDRKGLLYAAAWAAGIAAAADLLENCFLERALSSGGSGTWTRAATIAASIKWALVPVFVTGVIVGIWAWVLGPFNGLPPSSSKLDRARRWEPPAEGAWQGDERGICFSGGGIRSASFCLGVMQQLESGDGTHASALAKTRYLAAVSGGGYIAGAAQLHASLEQARRVAAARAAAGNDKVAADAAEASVRAADTEEALETGKAVPAAFRPGSAEEDHLRRHGNYLADTAGEWFAAIAQALGKLLANLALTGLVILAVSLPLGWIGRLLLGAKPEAVKPPGNWPHLPLSLVIALAFLALPALVLAAGRRHSTVVTADEKEIATGKKNVTAGEKQKAEKVLRRGRRTGFAASLAIALGAGAAVLATTAFVLPLLNGLGRHVAGLIGHPEGVTAAAWPTVLLTTVLGRVVTKALKREATGGAAPADPKAEGAPKKGRPNLFFAKNFVELVAGPVIVLVVVGYLTALATTARESGPLGVVWHFGATPIRDWHIAAAAIVIFVATLFTIDAVSWSMHRFYKRRLWSAFTYDPSELFEERDWSTPTKLSEHGRRLPGRPELVLCAAAQVSGPGVAPPGHRAVTWTFDHEWVGGPEIGWCSTKKMEVELEKHGRGGDVSMFGTIAIAGAAFGSAMGRHSKGSLNSVFALSNARLGVWLPNPAQLRDHPPKHETWSYRRHTLTYLVREIFGLYPPKDRWILVADGGHYENLGLVELFRRQCTKIVCIDASGDASGAVTTVAEALRNAEQELGVAVTVDEEELDVTPWDVAPGGGKLTGSTETLADALKSRLARRPILHATITYPPEAGGKTGKLIIGRSVLDPEAPWPVLSYAVGNDAFPNDPTGDQWFDADQFDDYVILGRYLGTRLLAEMDAIGWYS